MLTKINHFNCIKRYLTPVNETKDFSPPLGEGICSPGVGTRLPIHLRLMGTGLVSGDC